MHTLAIEARDTNESLNTVRKNGRIPAVFYGPKEENTPVSVDATTFIKLWREVGESSIISLEGVSDAKEALIQDVAVDPLLGTPVHADFYVIERGKKIKVTVPIEFIGESPAEKAGGIIAKTLHEVEMDVRPSELPQSLEVDLSVLTDMDSRITVADLVLPESAELSISEDETICSMTQAREEEPEPEAETEGEDVTDDKEAATESTEDATDENAEASGKE